jgi:hypothetical protein
MERPMYEFDAKEAGDTMALTHNGEIYIVVRRHLMHNCSK